MNREDWITDENMPGPYLWRLNFAVVIAIGLVGWTKFIFHDWLGWI